MIQASICNKFFPDYGAVYYFIFLMVLSPANVNAGGNAVECKPVLEKNLDWQTLRIRPHENELITCTLTQGQYEQLIHEVLPGNENTEPVYKSLFIGRLVDHPWMSRYLATQSLVHKDWDTQTGQPASGTINEFVRQMLSAPEFLKQIQKPFTGTGYVVKGASVEKVLVAQASQIEWLETEEPALVPYDALVHFILIKSDK